MTVIWMISSHFHPYIGGGERQALRQAIELQNRGWDVRVITRQKSPNLPENLTRFEKVQGIPVIRIGSTGLFRHFPSFQFVLLGFLYLWRQGRGGVYHAHGEGAPAFLAVIAAKLLYGSSIIKLRTNEPAYTQNYRTGIKKWRFILTLRWADCIFVVTKQLLDYLHMIGVPASHISYIPNGIELNQYRSVSVTEKNALRDKLDIPLDKDVFLYVGRLKGVKGVDILLNVWKLVTNRLESTKMPLLFVVGDGEERTDLERLSSALGLTHLVYFRGEYATVQDYYGAADAFVLPSRTEGLSNALLEALASGLPAIAANVGGCSDFIEEPLNGYLFAPTLAADCSEKVINLLNSKPNWKAMGKHSRKKVEEQASLDVVIDQIEAIYRTLMS